MPATIRWMIEMALLIHDDKPCTFIMQPMHECQFVEFRF